MAQAKAEKNVIAPPEGAEASEDSNLGHSLRELRRQKDWTLSEMSAMTGVPASTLSRIENGQVSLTLDKLLRLSRGLGIDITRLIAGPKAATALRNGPSGRRAFDLPGQGRVVRTPQYEYHYHCTELTPKRMVPMSGYVKARSLEEFGPLIAHEGEEYTYVLEGTIEVHTEFYEPLRLEAGGSVYFDSTMKHAYISIGSTPARLLCVCAGLDGSDTSGRLERNAHTNVITIGDRPPRTMDATKGGSEHSDAHKIRKKKRSR